MSRSLYTIIMACLALITAKYIERRKRQIEEIIGATVRVSIVKTHVENIDNPLEALVKAYRVFRVSQSLWSM
jgi:hypothetical protein